MRKPRTQFLVAEYTEPSLYTPAHGDRPTESVIHQTARVMTGALYRMRVQICIVLWRDTGGNFHVSNAQRNWALQLYYAIQTFRQIGIEIETATHPDATGIQTARTPEGQLVKAVVVHAPAGFTGQEKYDHGQEYNFGTANQFTQYDLQESLCVIPPAPGATSHVADIDGVPTVFLPYWEPVGTSTHRGMTIFRSQWHGDLKTRFSLTNRVFGTCYLANSSSLYTMAHELAHLLYDEFGSLHG